MIYRKCMKCGGDYSRQRDSLYCKCCEAKLERARLKLSIGGNYHDTDRHRKLKDLAKTFLASLGCTGIREEARDLSGILRYNYDVAGLKDGKVYIVECGGCQVQKLKKIFDSGYILYIWAYGADKPILYNPSQRVCHFCGNYVHSELYYFGVSK
jgi:hypothetical protein